MPFVTAGGHRLEYELLPGRPTAPTLVLLHEGLGSLALWRDFPRKLAAATGFPLLVYSRWGYGKSEPAAPPRGPRYMHDEALVTLPELRRALGLREVILIGHSDGASIALIHVGAGAGSARGLVLEAPHVLVEAMNLASIEQARDAFAATDLRQRLARYHDDVDGAFHGWNEAWLSPEFRDWNIEEYLAGVACPVLAIQGADDEYGTMAQLEAIERGVKGRFAKLVLPRCGHSPHRDQEAVALEVMATFVASLSLGTD
jgi:pimeloyl-ACP methyl ester carboxylesterase